MHGTRTPLRLWFWAAYLVATHTPGISAKQLQRQLGLSRYETAWLMLQKLRRAMVRPSASAPAARRGRGRRGLRRRGRSKAQSGPLPGRKAARRGRGRGPRPGLGQTAARRPRRREQALARPWIAANVEPGAIVHTDGWSGYASLPALGFDHRPIAQRWRNTEERQVILPRAHRALSNLKTWLQGTHRAASAKHLQVYLDEFVFRHNRRRTPMAAFQTLLGLGAAHDPTTYREITDAAA